MTTLVFFSITKEVVSTACRPVAGISALWPLPPTGLPRAPPLNPLLWAPWEKPGGPEGSPQSPGQGAMGWAPVPKTTAPAGGFLHPTPLCPVQQLSLRSPFRA